MNLLRTLTSPRRGGERGTPLPLALSDYITLLNTFSYQGNAYQLGSKQEEIGGDYRSLVAGAYKRDGVVFACLLVRLLLFSEARFQFRRLRNGRPGDLYGTAALRPLEQPWPGATTGDLLARMEQDASLAGNFFAARRPGGRIKRMRPDWVTIVLGSERDDVDAASLDAEVLGYLYHPGGHHSGVDPVVLDRGEVAHYAPIPDPDAAFRGMSWLTPVLNEIMADKAATEHKLRFFENGATPNIIVSMPPMPVDAAKEWVELFEESHAGVGNAYKTLFLGGGADPKVVGADFKQLDFKITQGAGETRIAAAAGVPPVIVGLSEGLQAATYCLPAGELVWTADGPRRIADVRRGDVVWSAGEQTKPCRVTWQGNVGEAAVYEVRTKNRVLRATATHPVLVRVPGHSRGGNASRHATVAWRCVAELRPGDQVVEALSLPDYPCVAPEWASADLARWLGAYVGDGCGAGTGAIRFAIPPSDRVRDHYERLTAELFDARIRYEERGFRIQQKATTELLGMLGFAGTAKTKTIPGWVFRLPREQRLAFLAGLMDTDGSIDKRGVGTLGFANRLLVEQARALFVSCGVQVSNVSYREQPAANLPQPGRRETYDFWAFAITSGLGAVPVADPLYRLRLACRRDTPEGGDASKAGLENQGFFTVRSIRELPPQPVYDISVEGEHSFFAAGVAVHNSNYGQARRRFADGTMRPLWRNAAGSLAALVDVPADSELWYDDRDIPFLQEDQRDAAEILSIQAAAIRTLIDGGFDPEKAVAAVSAGDLRQLQHTGLLSVQLQPPGEGTPLNGAAPAGTGELAAALALLASRTKE